MITIVDSGSLSLMEALRDSEIQKTGLWLLCYHYNHAHHCANRSHQLPYFLKLVTLAMGSNDYDNCGRQWQSQLDGSLEGL